jgi:hypothetical protein
MNDKDKIVLVYTGTDIIIARVKAELELQGISSIVKDGFSVGLSAGFGGGIPSAIDLFVTEVNLEKASEIINAIIEE